MGGKRNTGRLREAAAGIFTYGESRHPGVFMSVDFALCCHYDFDKERVLMTVIPKREGSGGKEDI